MRDRRLSPTREALLRLVRAQQVPTSTAALATVTGLHENTVRGHLDALAGDGHLTRIRAEVHGRGRPAWLWCAAEEDPSNAYAVLASVLAGTLARTSEHPIAQARDVGREWGRALAVDLPAQPDPVSARGTVVAVMRSQGFDPHDTGDAVRLRRCPLIEAASQHPQIVCSVHLGIVDGVLEGVGHTGGDSTLIPFTGLGECTLHIRVAS